MRRFLRLLLRRMDQEQSHPCRPIFVGHLSKMQDENLARLRSILEEASSPTSGRSAVNQKIGDYYASCMDEKAIDAKGSDPLKPELDRIAKLSSKSELADVAGSMIHTNVLFRFDSTQDFRDASQVIADADQGGLGLPDRDYYLKDDANRRNSARRMSLTCRRCSSFWETSQIPPPPGRKP